MSFRVSPEEHRAGKWRIDAIAPDFELLDVWRTPMAGGPEQFAEVFATVESMKPGGGSWPSRALFRLREWMGQVFGWDREANTLPIPGCEETSLRDRLDPDERAPLRTSSDDPLQFRRVYVDHREAFSELSNGTVHAVMHLSWVADDAAGHRANMAVYVKHRGRLGRFYMALIAPFRHWLVYPALMRQLDAMWRKRQASAERP